MNQKKNHRRIRGITVLQYAILLLLLICCFVPPVVMLTMSLRNNTSIYGDFWGLPYPPRWVNYRNATEILYAPTLRSLFVDIASNIGTLLFAVFSAFAFSRMRFAGKKILFYLVIAVMMVPSVLLLTPNFILADQLRIKDSLWGLILFYVAGNQAFAIFMLQTFFSGQPEELFESARLDGATESRCIWHILLPLSRPILITLFIMNFLSIYNDLIWPLLMITSQSKELLMPALQRFGSQAIKGATRVDWGVLTAGYTVATVPLFLIFVFGMKYYIEGVTSGAVKE